MANPLQPGAIIQMAADALPAQGDTTSDLSSPLEAVALFAHACMANLGFRLVGFNEDQKIEAECQTLAPRLPPQWNAGSPSSRSFVYAHTQSSMRFVIKLDRIGGLTEIRGLAVGDERIHRLELTTADYIDTTALPVRITLKDNDEEDRTDLGSKISCVFKNSNAQMSKLATDIKTHIVQRLIPGLHKEGYEEEHPDDRAARQDADASARGGARQPPHPHIPHNPPDPARPHPFHDPLAQPPRRPPVPMGDFPPPDFEDEHQLLQGGPHRNPFNIGHDDLNPPGLGPHDPLRPSFVPGGGFGGMPRPGGFGGMYPTFDSPLFQGQGGRGRGRGQDGFDPQVPPGARWDPLGPGGGPRFNNGHPDGFGGFGGDII